jgi:two-component system phosphate regulon response regulator PhoB
VRQRIVIIEDEADIVEMIRYNFRKAGFEVDSFGRGREGLEALRRNPPDLLLLDIMLPDEDGLSICRQLRAEDRLKELPVVFLTARGEEIDRIVGLEIGADDYVVKPFSPRELVARVKALLRRTEREQETPSMLRCGQISIDANRHEVSAADRLVQLTATEFRILQFLTARPGRVTSRDEIIDAALDRDSAVFDRTIDVHITAIRRKLGDAGGQIETVRGFGYKMRERVQEPTSAEAG